MARTDTLPHFLTDVADAIREKTGESGTIQASTFDTAISNISGSASPTNLSEFESSMEDVCDAFGENLIKKTDNYNTITNDAVTLYSPNSNCTSYIIRYRNGYYQIVCFDSNAILKVKNSSTLQTNNYTIVSNPNHPGFIEYPSYTLSSYYVSAYSTPNNIATLEEAIQIIQSNTVTYSYLTNNSDWGFEQYSADYYIPCTNMPMQNSSGQFINAQRISKNETISFLE